MSVPSTPGSATTGTPKKGVSPARNIIGLVVLLALAAVAWFEYSAHFGYNGAVKALEARTQDEEKGLMDVQEAETLLGKSPDGPGIEVEDRRPYVHEENLHLASAAQAPDAYGFLHEGGDSPPAPFRDAGCEIRSEEPNAPVVKGTIEPGSRTRKSSAKTSSDTKKSRPDAAPDTTKSETKTAPHTSKPETATAPDTAKSPTKKE